MESGFWNARSHFFLKAKVGQAYLDNFFYLPVKKCTVFNFFYRNAALVHKYGEGGVKLL